MLKGFTLFLFISLATNSFSQVKDCFPNCSVTFDDIERERIPLWTSVEAIGTKCDDNAYAKIKEFHDEDLKQFTFLRNKYCSALSGWEQIADCEHGGPPPCCTAPADNMPWRSVGPERAKAILMAEWHKVQSQRKTDLEKELNGCLFNLRGEAIGIFKKDYADAIDCLDALKTANTQPGDIAISNFTAQLNSLHEQMQVIAAKEDADPNNAFSVSNTLNKLKGEICAAAAKKSNEIHTPKPNGDELKTLLKPKVESVAVSTNNSATQQQQQYQTTANNYLDKANNSTNDINKAMNLNIAKINAMASGNTAQVQQIQNMQNQQTQESVGKLVNSATELLDVFQKAADRRQLQRQQNGAEDFRKAEAGDIESMKYLATEFSIGNNFNAIPKDFNQAIYWSSRAAALGDTCSLFQIGADVYLHGAELDDDVISSSLYNLCTTYYLVTQFPDRNKGCFTFFYGDGAKDIRRAIGFSLFINYPLIKTGANPEIVVLLNQLLSERLSYLEITHGKDKSLKKKEVPIIKQYLIEIEEKLKGVDDAIKQPEGLLLDRFAAANLIPAFKEKK